MIRFFLAVVRCCDMKAE